MLSSRIITGVGMVALIISTLTWLPAWTFHLLVGVVLLLALAEWGRLLLGATRSYRRILMTLGVACGGAQIVWPLAPALPLLLATCFALAALYLYLCPTLERYPHHWAVATTGVVYLGSTLPFFSRLVVLSHGAAWIALTVAAVALCDTGAYMAGRTWGRHRMAPLVSPNKTWEGFAGGIVGCLVAAIVVRVLALPHVAWLPLFGCAAVIAIVAPIGDLIESALKRAVHVKDSGTVLPGHGGILDRIDAYVFTVPVVYYFATWVQ